ncbi:MAG: methyltransferase domain-containing protein [Leptolyngbya sp. PLA1]|nr:methyltransferase domain-containing protein [Leptolyngbya sp. PLA1]
MSPRAVYLPGKVRLVHEDEHVLVVDKPAGIVTANLSHQRVPSVFDAVKTYVRDQSKRRGTRVWIIHRLDKEVSGLLVFAKTETAFGVLKDEFRSKRAGRLYAAVVEGAPPSPEGVIQNFLWEDPKGRMHGSQTPRGSDPADEDEGKLAVTRYRVARRGGLRTLVEVKLETGRKNQIRVHMAELGCPIVGDRRYGATSDPLDRVCLHGASLSFSHPATGRPLTFESPMPGSFAGLLGKTIESTEKPASPTPQDSPAEEPPMASHAPDRAPRADARRQSWDHVAAWYEGLIEERGSDHHEQVILPGTLRLLATKPGQRVLDVACGEGVLCRRLGALGVQAFGVDASERLIDAARRARGARVDYAVGDARRLADVARGPFDAAACVMALMNIEPLSPVLAGVASLLKPGGVFVGVILHPAFRAPGQTSWAWDAPKGSSGASPPKGAPRGRPVRQYRRVDGYLSPGQKEIVMNPGAAAGGGERIVTITYHRPIQAYVRALAEAGLLVDALEEWASRRVSQPGPRAAEENRARQEIPMFLAIRGRKL